MQINIPHFRKLLKRRKLFKNLSKREKILTQFWYYMVYIYKGVDFDAYWKAVEPGISNEIKEILK